MLVLHGLDDGLVPPDASEVLATLPNVERRTYPGLRHELHNEPEGPAILDEVDRLGPRACGSARFGLRSADNRTSPPGSASSAESVASATDPRNLIRFVPAKEAGPSTR